MTLPNDFSYATALTRLDLSSNRLRHLPLDFGLLFSLQVMIHHISATRVLRNPKPVCLEAFSPRVSASCCSVCPMQRVERLDKFTWRL